MTGREIGDIRLWYFDTYVYLNGVPVYVRGRAMGDEDVRGRAMGDEEEAGDSAGVGLACLTMTGESLKVLVHSMSQIVPIRQTSKIVDTGTRFGQVYVTRSPTRQYRKSICASSIVLSPRPCIAHSFTTLIRNYLQTSTAIYSPQEAKDRVLSGTALWSAVSDKILIGAVPNNSKFSCMWKGRLVGSFALNKGEPDVKNLVLSRSNGFLLESISEALPGVTCRVAR